MNIITIILVAVQGSEQSLAVACNVLVVALKDSSSNNVCTERVLYDLQVKKDVKQSPCDGSPSLHCHTIIHHTR